MKLYIREPGTERLLRLTASSLSHQFAILALAKVEFSSAVRRRARVGDLDGASASQLMESFKVHQQTRFLTQGVNDLVLDSACQLIDQYPLRAYDAIQLAGCLALKSVASEAPVFACADRQLLEAAEAEGLIWLDPTE